MAMLQHATKYADADADADTDTLTEAMVQPAVLQIVTNAVGPMTRRRQESRTSEPASERPS